MRPNKHKTREKAALKATKELMRLCRLRWEGFPCVRKADGSRETKISELERAIASRGYWNTVEHMRGRRADWKFEEPRKNRIIRKLLTAEADKEVQDFENERLYALIE